MEASMIASLLALSASTSTAHRAAVRAGNVELAEDLRKLGFEVARLLARVARSAA
jgi:hypothetical protein